MITFSIQVKAPERKRTALLRCLSAMVGPTRVSPGCVGARLYADLMDENILVLVEEWESREEFDRQLDPVKLKTLVAAIEFCSEAPVIHIDEVTREDGYRCLTVLPHRRLDRKHFGSAMLASSVIATNEEGRLETGLPGRTVPGHRPLTSSWSRTPRCSGMPKPTTPACWRSTRKLFPWMRRTVRTSLSSSVSSEGQFGTAAKKLKELELKP